MMIVAFVDHQLLLLSPSPSPPPMPPLCCYVGISVWLVMFCRAALRCCVVLCFVSSPSNGVFCFVTLP